MQTKLRIPILMTLAALLLAASVNFSGANRVSAQTTPPPAAPRTISVNGTGQVNGAPDVANVILGVTTEAPTAQEALDGNSQSMQTLLAALADLDIPSTDIQTQTVQLQPRYAEIQEQGGTPEVVGYTATNQVQVRVTDIDRLGEILDGAVSAGSNTINGIWFEVEDQADLYAQALDAAMENARAKAEHLAGLANGQLGEVVSIVESSAFPYPAGGGRLLAAEQAVPVQPGTQIVSASVQVTWSFEGGIIPPTGNGTATPTRAGISTATAVIVPTRAVTQTPPAATETGMPAVTQTSTSPSPSASPSVEPTTLGTATPDSTPSVEPTAEEVGTLTPAATTTP